jgi:hypothetical protein
MRGSGVAQVMQVMQVAGAPARTLPEGVSA